MSALDLIGLTMAFLAPLPPERPEPPRPLNGNAWAAALVIGSVCLIMIVPMVAIWGFYRPDQTFRTRCAASGGHVRITALDGSGPHRCDHDAPRPGTS